MVVEPVRTPLTYYGGKQKLAQEIVALMPPHVAYLEPFAGGGAVFFAKPRVQRETLNDLDGSIMAFWRALRERPGELARAVELTPYSRAEWQACQLGGVPTGDDVELARRLLVEVDQSYFRGRKSWSRPAILPERRGRWQPGTWVNMPDKLLAAADRLQGVCLEYGDAVDLIPRWDLPETVIYCDPPYVGEHRLNSIDHCYRVDAEPDLWSRLVEVLKGVGEAAVILSCYPCEEVGVLEEAGWLSMGVNCLRHRAQAGRALEHAPEMLWLSPRVHEVPTRLFVDERFS